MKLERSLNIAMAIKDRDARWLSKKLRVSIAQVSAIKTSKNPTTDTLQRLADAFEMKPSEFLALSEAMDD